MLWKLLALAFCCILMAGTAAALEYFVTPDGDDANPGSRELPFATPGRARDALRALKREGKLAAYPIQVHVLAGTYEFSVPLEFTAADSGLDGSCVYYLGEKDAEVRFVGGRRVGPFEPVSDTSVLARLAPDAREHVRVCNLRAQGITQWGELPDQFTGGAGAMELFFNDQPMTVARWPNDGFATIAEVVDPGSMEEKRGGVFRYSGDRPERWLNAGAAYLLGYWCHDWREECIRISKIDPDEKTISLAVPHHYGICARKEPRRFYAFNLLEELDQPGEYYIDRIAGLLYFWPPRPIENGRVFVSTLDDAVVVAEDAQHLCFVNLTIEIGHSAAVRVQGGEQVLFEACTLRNVGGAAVVINEGTGHRVQSCDIYGTGAGGIYMSGGDRTTLTPSNHLAENNYIHHYARLARTYEPGLRLQGVGCRALHNMIHDAPHMAIGCGGNDHVMQFNDIFRVCLESDDAGATYIGRDWTARGHVLACNVFREIGPPAEDAGGIKRAIGAFSVYLDDCASGITAAKNIFIDSAMPVLIGGGRDNVFENNLFIHCTPAIRLDARGVGWAKEYAVPGGGWYMYDKLDAVPYKSPPWRKRYPGLADILEKEPARPRGNRIVRNVSVGGTMLVKDKEVEEPENELEPNMVLENDNGVFMDAAARDYRFPEKSPVWEMGFEQIPIEKIGLYRCAGRPALPKERTFPQFEPSKP